MSVASRSADFSFQLAASHEAARAGAFTTPHGTVLTPAFMPVGTLATVRALDPLELRQAGASMLLANAYHLHLRPGDDVIQELGGLHRFMAWDGPLLTDSGGFQVFSLQGLRHVDEEGVEFRSHIDGSRRRFTPELVIRIQRRLGADVMMQFDHVIPGRADYPTARDASERSLRWLERSRREFERTGNAAVTGPHSERPSRVQTLFPIVQGGTYVELRREAARAIRGMDNWDGYAIGGLSVGEPKHSMLEVLEALDSELPRERPRYLMGVGFPADLLEGIRRGVDLFDCVAPTRMGRNGTAFTSAGRINVKNAALRCDAAPLDPECSCTVCTRFSRAYLRHLFVSEELLALRLLSLHNVHFLLELMRRARAAILGGHFGTWASEWIERLAYSEPEPAA
jgi:queuine tRNA-ribosyltransferase